jgi:DNA polymerase family A
MTCSWQDLPFREIWVVDTEFYPGPGLAHGGVDGDPITPLCLVAVEMRSGRIIRQWQDELGRTPPYSIGADSVVMGYLATAELGTHLALKWKLPANVLDPYLEFRHLTNDGSLQEGKREKGFYSILGALSDFKEDHIDSSHKRDMRERIVQGPPYTAEERREILLYCEHDTLALERLVKHIVPTIRSIPHALFRGQVQCAVAHQEHRGIHVDLPKLTRLRTHWDPIRCELVKSHNPGDIYEIVDGVPHWREQKFIEYLIEIGAAPYWKRPPSGDSFDKDDKVFRDMCGKFPQIVPVRETRNTLSKLRINSIAVGSDGRNRCLLSAYGTKTARNAPKASKYIFGPSKWLRFLITPPPGRVLIHRDYMQQEVTIAAIKSGDPALLQACDEGDVYLGMAEQLGFDRNRPGVRDLFKIVVLAMLYGMKTKSMAQLTGLSLFEAAELLARCRARFWVFEDYVRNVQAHAGLDLEIGTELGWYMQCPSIIKPHTVRNFPFQSAAAEIYHVATILCERRGLEPVASLHDALFVEANAADRDDVDAELDRAMRDASAVVLKGHELRTDSQIINAGEPLFNKNGASMWETINGLLVKLEKRIA